MGTYQYHPKRVPLVLQTEEIKPLQNSNSKKILLALFDHYVLIYLERKNETVIDEVQNIITGDSDILKNSNDRFLVVTFVRKLLTSDTNEEDINIGKKQ